MLAGETDEMGCSENYISIYLSSIIKAGQISFGLEFVDSEFIEIGD